MIRKDMLSPTFFDNSFPKQDILLVRKSKFLQLFIILSCSFLSLIFLWNLLKLSFPSKQPNLYVFVIYFPSMLILLALWYFLRRKNVPWISWTFLLTLILVLTFSLPPEVMDKVWVLYAMPIFAAGMIIGPIFSFLFACISLLAYSANIFIFQSGIGFNLLVLPGLINIAVIAWFFTKTMQDALSKESETNRRYMNLIENVQAAVYITEPGEGGKFLFVSPRFIDLLGYTRSEWNRNPEIWKRSVHKDDIERIIKADRLCLEEHKPLREEYRMIHKNGKTIWVSDHADVFSNAEGEMVQQGFILDITEQKKLEQMQSAIYSIANAALEAEELDDLYQSIHSILDMLFPVKNIFIAIHNEKNDIFEFPFFIDEFDANPGRTKAKGSLTRYVFETGRPLLVTPDLFRKMSRKGLLKSIGKPSLDWMGVPLKVNGKPYGVLAVQTYIRNIRYAQDELDMMNFVSTQIGMAVGRKLAEDQLQESEKRYRGIFDGVREAIFIESMDGRILDVSESACRMFGYSRDEMLKLMVYDLVPPGTQGIRAEDLVNTKEPGKPLEWVNVRADGEIFPVELSARIHEIDGKEVVLVVVRDITMRKKSEEQLYKAIQEKEVLLRELHHRVKNNLQVMTSLLGLQSELLKDKKAKEALRVTQMRVKSIALIHEELYQAKDLAKVNFGEYLKLLVENLSDVYNAEPRIQFHLDLNGSQLNVDTAVPCGMIVNELVTNSLKYAFPDNRGGNINIHLHPIEDSQFLLIIEDDGVGIRKDMDIAHHDSLGMQLVQILAQQLNGKVDMESGHGTRFKVTFRERNGK